MPEIKFFTSSPYRPAPVTFHILFTEKRYLYRTIVNYTIATLWYKYSKVISKSQDLIFPTEHPVYIKSTKYVCILSQAGAL